MQQDLENLPIDIHYNKLLDWLISRRHCQQQWQAAAFIIREKINAALQDLPKVEEIENLVEETDINYFHCQKIVSLLKDTECGETNIFGQYSSQKMKDWSDIIRRYEKEDVYLAETAQMIARNVNYEIPAIKKQVAKCQQIQKECDKKEADYTSKVSELRKKYSQSCKELGIKGEKIKSELSALVEDLPKVFDGIAKKTKDLEPAVAYYDNFTGFLLNRQETDSLPMLKVIQRKGNVTTYEWRTGEKPVSVEESSITIDTTDEQDAVEDGQDIDWGDIGTGTEETPAEIDFDISGITIESGGTDEGKANIDIEPLGEEIDWGEIGEETEKGQSEKSEKGVAKGEDAVTVIDNPITRNLFLDDLYEIEAFLSQRSSELESGGNVLASSQFQSAPATVQLGGDTVTGMLGSVREVITQLTSVQLQHLMLIRNSPRYVDRLKDSLRQTLTLADKMEFHGKDVIVKRNESVEEEKCLGPKLAVLVEKTKQMKKEMEAEISKKYKNRPVNIMGEINTI